jgi:hypothetical protein
MARQRMDPDTRYRIMQHEALRTFARRHHMAILFGPFIARAILLVAVVAGLMALWLYVDHVVLGVGALALAALIGGVWIFVSQANSGVQARQARRVAGRPAQPGFGLGWSVAGLCILLVGTGWLALWSPYA